MSLVSVIEQLNKNPAATLKKLSTEKVAEVYRVAMHAYHNTSKPLMSDQIFDLVHEHLEKIDPKNPALQEVGADVANEDGEEVNEKDKVLLPYWMGSLNKIRDDQKTIDKWATEYTGDVVVSDKLDGISGLLTLEKKKSSFTQTLYTRGNGTYGKNISNALSYLAPSLPKNLKEASKKHSVGASVTVAVRGEIIISKNNWETIKHLGANARNVVAGTLNKATPKEEIASKLEFVAYELVHPKMTPLEGLAFLKDAGFKVVYNVLMSPPISMETLSATLMNRRQSSPYEVDGIVVFHNKVHKVIKEKNPKYAFAFKSIHTHTEVEVVVTSVEWNVSKDGYIKPTVLFNPVTLAGVKINRATGFNAGFIEKNLIGVGSKLVIIRSGDVIPHIQRVLTPSATGNPDFPTIAYEWNDTHVDIVATEGGNLDVVKKTLEHFSKKLEMTGVGPGIIAKIVDAKMSGSAAKLSDILDAIPIFMSVTKEDLLKIPGFQSKSAEKVAASIKSIKDTVSCIDLMSASNIFGRGLGDRKIQSILKAHPEVLSKKIPKVADVTKVDGIGAATAKTFCEGLPKFFSLVDKMGIKCLKQTTEENVPKQDAKAGPSKAPAAPGPGPAPKQPSYDFSGKTIVFTGFRNKEWEKTIEAAGGKVSSSVSKNTAIVVASDPTEDSTKLKKARDAGVKIMSVADFGKLLI